MKKRSAVLVQAFASFFALAAAGCSHAVSAGGGPDPGASAAPLAAAPKLEVYRIPIAGLPSYGNPDALVTVVEFSDYECPFCQHAEQTMTRLRATYGDALRFVVAERPLPFHERARPAALAALAAEAQGKFEPMHARLFALGGSLEETSIARAATESGLDLARFEADRSAAPLAPSEQLADHVGVHGTPTFFVSGRRVVGAQPYETFRDVVDERLAAAKALVTSGVRPRDVYDALTTGGADHVVAETDDAKGNKAGCGGKNCGGGAADVPVGDTVETVPTEGAPTRGLERASITIVAFADFECPFCAKAEASLRAVEETHPGDVRLVFKNKPLPMHSHARLAAKAALAANAQGRFWDFHDRLLAHPAGGIDRAGLLSIATDLGLDSARFAADLDDPRTAAQIARDEADGEALGVTGTPTFFVNGRRVVGAQPPAVFEAAIAKSR